MKILVQFHKMTRTIASNRRYEDIRLNSLSNLYLRFLFYDHKGVKLELELLSGLFHVVVFQTKAVTMFRRF